MTQLMEQQQVVINGAAKSSAKLRSYKPSPAEVVAAVESLYSDQVKPFGRILLKRVGERAKTAGGPLLPLQTASYCDPLPCIDARRLRKVCEKCNQLYVQPEDGGEYAVFLVGRPSNFVDVNSPCNPYPEDMWVAAEAYFGALTGEDIYLPGGRYACAMALAVRNLPFLVGRTVGEICHIVQLAISQYKILGYAGHQMVPYSVSETRAKEQCANHQTPVNLAKGANSAMPLATLDEARTCLREILASSSTDQGLGIVPLPNVKRLFRSRFQLELSETVLGHSRLCELLQDSRFHDICTLRLQGNGYFVVQVLPFQTPPEEFLSPNTSVLAPTETLPAIPPLAVQPPHYQFWSTTPAATQSVMTQLALSQPQAVPPPPSYWAPTVFEAQATPKVDALCLSPKSASTPTALVRKNSISSLRSKNSIQTVSTTASTVSGGSRIRSGSQSTLGSLRSKQTMRSEASPCKLAPFPSFPSSDDELAPFPSSDEGLAPFPSSEEGLAPFPSSEDFEEEDEDEEPESNFWEDIPVLKTFVHFGSSPSEAVGSVRRSQSIPKEFSPKIRR